jgi:glycine oxidase
MPSNRSPDVIVVGGGVIGCAMAYYLAREGVGVEVIERGEIGSEASGAAAGMLAPLAEVEDAGPFQELCIESLRMFPSLAETLRDETGIDIEYLPTGILRVARDEAEERRLRDLAACPGCLPAVRHGLPLHWLDPQELRVFEPALSPEMRGALYSPQERQVNADRLTQAFVRAAAARGATLRRNLAVRRLLTRNGRVEGVRTADGDTAAGHVVLAAGPWTRSLAASLGIDLPLFPVRGQMLALPSKSAPRQVVWGSDGYLVPKANGLVFAGATVEKVGFRRRTTAAGLRGLAKMASSLAPRLGAFAPVDSWAGLRPCSADGLPLLGPLPGWEGVSVATGHYRNGILLSPVTGRFMARAIKGDAGALTAFEPERFLRAAGPAPGG